MKIVALSTAVLASLFFVAYGILFVIDPSGWFANITNAELETTTSLIEVRSTYGGMTVALGIFIGLLYLRGFQLQSMHLIALVLVGMATARTLGLLIDGPGNTLMYVYLALELIGAALALLSARSLRNAA